MLKFIDCKTEAIQQTDIVIDKIIEHYSDTAGNLYSRHSSPTYKGYLAWFDIDWKIIWDKDQRSAEQAHNQYQLCLQCKSIILSLWDLRIPTDVIGVIIKILIASG